MIGKMEKGGNLNSEIRAFGYVPSFCYLFISYFSPLFFLFSLFPFFFYRSYYCLAFWRWPAGSQRLAFVGVCRLAYGIVAYGMSIQFLMFDVDAGCS